MIPHTDSENLAIFSWSALEQEDRTQLVMLLISSTQIHRNFELGQIDAAQERRHPGAGLPKTGEEVRASPF